MTLSSVKTKFIVHIFTISPHAFHLSAYRKRNGKTVPFIRYIKICLQEALHRRAYAFRRFVEGWVCWTVPFPYTPPCKDTPTTRKIYSSPFSYAYPLIERYLREAQFRRWIATKLLLPKNRFQSFVPRCLLQPSNPLPPSFRPQRCP